MKATVFDQKFNAGEKDIIEDLDLLMMKRPGRKQHYLDNENPGERPEPITQKEETEDPE